MSRNFITSLNGVFRIRLNITLFPYWAKHFRCNARLKHFLRIYLFVYLFRLRANEISKGLVRSERNLFLLRKISFSLAFRIDIARCIFMRLFKVEQ